MVLVPGFLLPVTDVLKKNRESVERNSEKSYFQAKKEPRRLEPTGLAGRIDAAKAAFPAHGSEKMEDLPAITGIKAGWHWINICLELNYAADRTENLRNNPTRGIDK